MTAKFGAEAPPPGEGTGTSNLRTLVIHEPTIIVTTIGQGIVTLSVAGEDGVLTLGLHFTRAAQIAAQLLEAAIAAEEEVNDTTEG